MGQRGSTTQGLFVRHGSDEHGDPRPHSRRFSSRDRSDRQSASLPPIHRIHPGGTQERQDWLEALKDVTARVTTLESSNRNLAQTIARVEQNHGAKLEELNDDRTADKAYVEGVFFNNPTSVKGSIEKLEARINDLANFSQEALALQFSR